MKRFNLQTLFRLLIIYFVIACCHATSEWECATGFDRILITCESDIQQSDNNVQYCCQNIKNGPFVCKNQSPFQTAAHRKLAAVLIGNAEQPVGGDFIASDHNANRLNQEASVRGVDPYLQRWDTWFQDDGTSCVKTVGVQCQWINNAQDQPDCDPFIAVGGRINQRSLTMFCYDGKSYIPKALDVRLRVGRIFASVAWHEYILTVCGGQNINEELLMSCEVIDFRGSSPQRMRYYVNGFGTTGKSQAALLYVNYMDKVQLINLGFLGVENHRYSYNRTIRSFFLNDSSQQTFGPIIGELTEDCKGPIAFRYDRFYVESSSRANAICGSTVSSSTVSASTSSTSTGHNTTPPPTNIEWDCAANADHILLTCQTDFQGQYNSVQYCCQKKAVGPLVCDETQPFPANKSLKLGSALLETGNVFVFGTDGTLSDGNDRTAYPFMGQYSVKANRLYFDQILMTDNRFNSSLVYSVIALIPSTTEDSPQTRASEHADQNTEIKVLLIGVDEKGNEPHTNITVFTYTPPSFTLADSFHIVPGDWEQWFVQGTSYALLTGQHCSSWIENIDSLGKINVPFVAVGGRNSMTSNAITVVCGISGRNSNVLHHQKLKIKLREARQFATVVWHKSTKILLVCGGQTPTGTHAGQLISSCEEVNLGSTHQTIQFYGNAFGPFGKSKAGLLYMHDTSRKELLLNFGYMGIDLTNGRYAYKKQIQNYDWSTHTFGTSYGTLQEECVGLVALTMKSD